MAYMLEAVSEQLADLNPLCIVLEITSNLPNLAHNSKAWQSKYVCDQLLHA